MIEALTLSKRFTNNRAALHDVSFHVGRGDVYCLLGGPGSGKTTTVDIFRSAVKPTSGRATIEGVDATREPVQIRRNALFVTPRQALVPGLTTSENVSFFCRLAGLGPRTVLRRMVENALRRVGIAEREFDLPADELQRQEARVLIWLAVGWLREVTAVLMDDPTRDLDARGSEWIIECLREYRDSGKAIFVTSSDVRFVTRAATRIGILQDGHKEPDCAPDEIAHQNVAEFYTGLLGRQPNA